MADDKGHGGKLLGGAVILGGVGLLAYFFLTQKAKAEAISPTPTPSPIPGTGGKTPPPVTGTGLEPVIGGKTPPVGTPTRPPPSVSNQASLVVGVSNTAGCGDTYFYVKDSGGKWGPSISIKDRCMACVEGLQAGWAEVNVQKNGLGAIPGVTNGVGGFNHGNISVYLTPGRKTGYTLDMDDTRFIHEQYFDIDSEPTCAGVL